jgi:hypothetical protein
MIKLTIPAMTARPVLPELTGFAALLASGERRWLELGPGVTMASSRRSAARSPDTPQMPPRLFKVPYYQSSCAAQSLQGSTSPKSGAETLFLFSQTSPLSLQLKPMESFINECGDPLLDQWG